MEPAEEERQAVDSGDLHEGESADAVPMDQALATAGETPPVLMLAQGKYASRFRIKQSGLVRAAPVEIMLCRNIAGSSLTVARSLGVTLNNNPEFPPGAA